MLTMRFNRTGRKNRVAYRVVLQEHTQAPGKRHVEILGSYDPHNKQTVLKKERIAYWLGQGVQKSEAVHNLLVREGVIDGKKIPKKMPKPEVKEEVQEVSEAPVETPVSESSEVEPAEATAEEAGTEAPVVAEETSEAETPVETEKQPIDPVDSEKGKE